MLAKRFLLNAQTLPSSFFGVAVLALALSAARPLRAQTPVPSAPTPVAQQTLNNQKVQQLITQVEAMYASGVTNYQANRLEAARLDFDAAVDAMLTSGMDVKTEGPLADEFERVLNQINSLEVAALKQGNGFSPKIEEAPLDTATDTTFAANPELVRRLNSELNTQSDLPLVINDQVAGYIGVFSTSEVFRKHMAASLQRVGKYRGMMQRVLAEEGVPQDLIYLAVAESGFQPQVVNRRSGAGGMWQFMTYTGAEYGLNRNGYFDYRFDPEKSSRAYARYIKKLYGMFGDWNLAMASYDWGPGAVQKALLRTSTSSYWDLYAAGAMPSETRAYVPKILAAILMAKNPEVYGLNKLTPSPPIIYDTVQTSYSVDLKLVADVTQSSVQELVALNPALLRLQTPRDISFDLHIPPGTKDLYTQRLKDIPNDERNTWRFHIVRQGETVETIAAALHASASAIAETNGITVADPMSVDDELVVPIEPVAARGPQRYTLRRGDSLVTVADRFNVSVEELREWNGLRSSSVRPGRALYVAQPVRLRYSGVARGGRRRHAGGGRVSRREARAGRRGSSARHAGGRGSSRASSRSSARSSSRSSHAPARSSHAGGGSGKRRRSR